MNKLEGKVAQVTGASREPRARQGNRFRRGRRELGELKDIAASANFLACSDSDFYTGQNLCPGGGDVMV